MFPALRLSGIAAAVALLGVMVARGPFADQELESPAPINSEPGAIARYVGTPRALSQHDEGTIDVLDWGSSIQDERVSGEFEMDDPRVSGISHCSANAFVTDRGAGWFRTHSCRLFDDEGSWRSTSHGYMAPGNGGIHYQDRLVGEGAYDGLFAIQRCDMLAQTAIFECEGVIFQGGFPDMPAEAPARPPGE